MQTLATYKTDLQGFLVDWTHVWLKYETLSHNEKWVIFQQIQKYDQQGNISACSHFQETLTDFYQDFYRFIQFTKSPFALLKGSHFQKFLLELTINKDKYNLPLRSQDDTVLIAKYIKSVTMIGGLPGPIVYDLFNMVDKNLNFLVPLNGPLNILFGTKKKPVKINTWGLYDNLLALRAKNCNFKACKDLNDTVETLKQKISEKELQTFLNILRKPDAHLNINATWFNPPMVPFCWFSNYLNWRGQHMFQADGRTTTTYNDIVPKKLKWCDLFKPSFPIYQNCFTANTRNSVKTFEQTSLIIAMD